MSKIITTTEETGEFVEVPVYENGEYIIKRFPIIKVEATLDLTE